MNIGARYVGIFRDAVGNIEHVEDIHNHLANEGANWFLNVALLRSTTGPTQWFIRMYNDTPVNTDSLASLTGEPSSGGYTVKTLNANSTDWPTFSDVGGNRTATSATVTWTASGGNIGPVTYFVLATHSTSAGKIISYAPLSQSRTINSGASLDLTVQFSLTSGS